MDASIKIQHLQQKISILQEKQQQLVCERHKHIADLILKFDLLAVDDTLLAGALFFVREKISIHDPLAEVWRQAGEKFLKRDQRQRKNRPSTQAFNSTPQSSSTSIEQGEV